MKLAIHGWLDLCYTVFMSSDQHIWRVWASFLQRWGLENWVASLLEAAGPLTLLGAQVVYFSQPLLNRSVPEDHLEALARILEDSTHTQAFVNFLREAPTQ